MKPQKYRAIGYESPHLSRALEVSIASYCTEQGLELVEVLRDENSSKHLNIDDRPAGRHLLRKCRQLKARNIVAANLYSLFKDTVDAGRQMPKWQAKGIRLHLLDLAGHPYVVEGDVGRVIARLMETLRKMENRNIRERIGAGLAARKVRGFAYTRPPFGKDRIGSLFVENSEEQKVIKRMHSLKREGLSYNAIATRLNGDRVPTKEIGKWHPSTVQGIMGRNPVLADGKAPPSWKLRG